MDKTALVKCDSYEKDEVYAAVSEAIRLTGGLEDVIRPGMRVAIKANLLTKKTPESACITHPSVVAAIAKAVQELGAKPFVVDSPGGPFTRAMMNIVYGSAEYDKMAEETGCELNWDTSVSEHYFEAGSRMKQIQAVKAIVDADAVIDAAKLKTHGLMAYTGAVKNLFGVIPGTTKVEYHYRFPMLEDFGDMLVDIAEFIKPVISIIDGVYGMEGEGPTHGDPRKVGVIIASKSPYAADAVGMHLIGFGMRDIATMRRAIDRGLISENFSDIEIVGENVEDYVIDDFVKVDTREAYVLNRNMPKFLSRLIGKFSEPKPVFEYDKCVGCGVCVRSCPPKALRLENKKPVVDLDKCIRCFCCAELCPQNAAHAKRSKLLRFIR